MRELLTAPIVVLPACVLLGVLIAHLLRRFEPKDTTVHTEPSVNPGGTGWLEPYTPGDGMKYGIPTGTPRVGIPAEPGVENTLTVTDVTDEAP